MNKKYGLLTAIAMVVGIVIGSGIFFKIQNILSITNGNVWLGILALIIGGIIMIICALTFAILATKYTEINGIVESFIIPKGLKEGVQFEIDETTIGRIVYVPNQTYRREGNDLYGTFIYSREYEGLQTEIQSPDPNETIGQITLKEGNYCIEGKGFEDTESGERGNYFVSISLM